MGQLSLPERSRVYIDTAPIIYSVEKHVDYWHLVKPFWLDLSEGKLAAVTSELTILETLVQPVRQGNQKLIEAYETLLTKTEIELYPIGIDVLRRAAHLRAIDNLKVPDAIHAATAAVAKCDLFITNDDSFRRLSSPQIVILSDLA